MTDDGKGFDHPFFARMWRFISEHEPESIRALRRENLAGLSGRVLEVGAGIGTNFALYPTTVDEVVAVEPERRLSSIARQVAASAPVPVTVTRTTIEELEAEEQFDAIVCSLVLCSVDYPEGVVRQLFSRLRPGGELRYLEHVASDGMRGRLQKMADATVWPRVSGNCHTHRHTERTIVDAGFVPQVARRDWVLPAWMPMPTSEVALGRAIRPA